MLKISFLEFLLRGLPEAFLLIFAIYTFTKSFLQKKSFLFSSLLLGVLVYLIRFLPIHYGVHTLIVIIAMITLSTYINKIDIIKSIKASIVAIILEFFSEGINVFIIQFVFKKDMNLIFSSPLQKTLYGLPSLLIFGLVVMMFYLKLNKKKELISHVN